VRDTGRVGADDELTEEQADRASGVLLGAAVGDALGVHYEFATPLDAGTDAQMLGGGLGDFAPGEWSDDTSMSVVVAEVVARRGEVSSEAALDEIALGFVRWLRSGPPDVGLQTSAVLSEVARRLDSGEAGPSRIAQESSLEFARSHPHAAGNGALMRTAPVALAHLRDRRGGADAARSVAGLTHADPLAADACVLWCEAVRVAVMEGRTDLEGGLDLLGRRRPEWTRWLAEASDPELRSQEVPGRQFAPNGFTVTALQAAAVAVLHTDERPGQFAEGLHAAIRIGDDTDTVAAIAGALLGARWGASAIPRPWIEAVHGWPGYRASDLLALGRTR
jgi:ADP-ribosyl-[dinitrogen reductase] hydrolase